MDLRELKRRSSVRPMLLGQVGSRHRVLTCRDAPWRPSQSTTGAARCSTRRATSVVSPKASRWNRCVVCDPNLIIGHLQRCKKASRGSTFRVCLPTGGWVLPTPPSLRVLRRRQSVCRAYPRKCFRCARAKHKWTCASASSSGAYQLVQRRISLWLATAPSLSVCSV
jgi:hypothetical protein